jgi:cell pole-organizing protein PopZ
VAGATERPHPDAKPEQAKAPAPQPAPSAPPTPEASTVATAPDAPQSAPTAPPKMGSGAVCEKCGAEVSDAQKNLSQLFTNKTLCKTCLEAP